MIRFRYAISTFPGFLSEMAKQFGSSVENNTLQLPEPIGKGYLKSVDLPNGLQALIGDFTLHQDLLIERSKTNMEYYVFICDRVTNNKKLYVDVDQDRMEGNGQRMEVMYLLSFLSDLNQFATAGTHLQSIRVIISKEWLARYLRIDQLENVLQRYLSLKAKSIHIREMDFGTKTLMNEILDPPDVSPVETAFLQNRIMMMVENFFAWMYDQLSVMEMQIHMTRDEIEQMMKVEESLTGDLSNAPTIKQLSVQAAMSPSKLKKQFKDVYGFPIYEYFQKKRMEKARAMLLEGNRTIKAVGRELGFSNLSNFSVAFRKEHQLLPSQLLKIREES